MKANNHYIHRIATLAMLCTLVLYGFLTGCTAINPKPEQLQLPVEAPVARQTSFSAALTELGMQSTIYGNKLLKIQCREIEDVTGTSYHSGGEIPKSVTVMVRSALNAIGGQVIYIPYWPEYVAGAKVSGYPESKSKLVPDVILSGGITEFDRGLTTVDRTRNFDAQTEDVLNAPSWFDNKTIGLDYAKGDKWNKAKIAIDFNLVSYRALCGIPKMQASNGLMVYKGIEEEELGFTLFGPTLGLRGSVKKIQGRHDAVRLLVQVSVIQLVGRFLDLPYWQLIEDMEPDPVVMENLKNGYQQKDPKAQVLALKRLLWLHGHSVPVTDQMDEQTKAVLARMVDTYDGKAESIGVDTFVDLYLSVPVSGISVELAKQYDRKLNEFLALAQKPVEKKKSTPAPKRAPETKATPPDLKKHGEPMPKSDEPEPVIEQTIIITPVDVKTDYYLKRIIHRINNKHGSRSDLQDAPYQAVSVRH